MAYEDARELARIRHQLHERLLACRTEGTDDLLGRLRGVADKLAHVAPEVQTEYERWRLRFDLLAGRAL